MKVDSGAPVPGRLLRSAKPGGKAGGGTFAAQLSDSGHKAAVSGGAPIGALGAMLAAEAIDEPGERRRRALRRGGKLLDVLDDLRLGLLTGGLSRSAIAELVRLVGEARTQLDDPGLEGLLDEIDLRAQVELAKHARGP